LFRINSNPAKPINEYSVPNGILVYRRKREQRRSSNQEIQKENPAPLEVLKSFVSLINKENPLIALATTASRNA
jgi:hypothetical protein